ncbi:diaminopropionate ammonia-lyase [Mesorhizobium sp. B2-4-14]|uniref:diaminopropionate ammonia-lyase n=1 Tax=Mesorhizobium sp. B2-4-14 TaxID=2589935 RepID=UPI00112A74F7|nr:diaminopropionate ammonia-lyase [Mesorhizobium sp. B2-4-14]TPL02568.1 diaminopropionate ammonia-lyase [Mesorhizobium sp. B2-4-14]
MFLLNCNALHRQPLIAADAETLGVAGADIVEHFLAHRDNHLTTPLHALPALAAELGLGALHVKDEGFRLGLGSFKALGGAYAVFRLVLEEAEKRLGRPVDVGDLDRPDVRAVAATMTVACATDGNHGRSVAQGAELAGAKAVIFVHSGVSQERIAAIARYGAEMVRVDGNYDDSVRQAAKVAADRGWTVVSDTSWPGYERIPGLVMQGYTAIVREALRQLREPPTHVFVQAGVGGIAAAVAGHLAIVLGGARPIFTVVEPACAACVVAAAQAGRVVKVAHDRPTVMAMLECYEASQVAWRVLARTADAFMTVDEDDAIAVMRRLARPAGSDPSIVAGESGGVGLAGVMRAVAENKMVLGLDGNSRVLVINTEGATDPQRYAELVGTSPANVLAGKLAAEATP